jgi:uncharacterized protein (TIGR01777 family)
MNVLVTGASGFIGSALVPRLIAAGHSVRRLGRRAPAGAGDYRWDPSAGRIDRAALTTLDAAVHLAGETIDGRWTAAKKARILRSRVDGTRMLSEALAEVEPRPRVLVTASAVGLYGDRGDEALTEESAPGDSFLAEVVKQWEAASAGAEAAGIRVVRLRFGIVLSPAGGALRRMLIPFRLGLGGRLGSGRQWLSWISLNDVLRAIEHSITDEAFAGAANAVAPNPVTNAELTRTLARVLRRPAILPVPAPILRLALGEIASELLSSVRARPARLAEAGFEFEDPELEPALRRLLDRS